MHLPFLNLSIGEVPSTLKESATQLWLRAVGERPDLPSWKNVRHRKHAWLHSLAVKADGYRSAYEKLPAEELMEQNRYSVEHVVPRSKINDASDLESDPFNWILASRRANSARSNLPLKLWLNGPGQPEEPNASFEMIDGQLHYLPPADQRARLSRKWLYAHATYPHDVTTPSVAQLRNLGKIVSLARKTPIHKAERQVAIALHDLLGYSNPLLTNDAQKLYTAIDWYELLGEVEPI